MPRVKKQEPQEGDLILDDVAVKAAPKKRAKKDRGEFYLSPKEFEDEIRLYYKTGDFTNRLGDMIKRLAYNLSFKPNFINYSYRDEMVSDAIEKMSRAVVRKCYKIDSGFSPFAYFTQIAWNACINRISKEKKIKSVHDDYVERIYSELIEDQGDYDIHIKNNRRNSDECDD